MLIDLGGLYLGLSAMESDIGDHVDELQADLNQGFDKVVADIGAHERGDHVRTDGVGQPVHVGSLPDGRPSGNGALGGMLAGGAVGLPFGPAGAVVGGVLGGLIGNEIEFQRLKERLTQTARRYLSSHANIRPQQLDVTRVVGPGTTDNDV